MSRRMNERMNARMNKDDYARGVRMNDLMSFDIECDLKKHAYQMSGSARE